MIADLSTVAMPPEIAAGLAGQPPSLASRALAALELMARERQAQVDPLAAWTGSGLTGDGFPLELAFSTADAALRWTFDPVPAGRSPREGRATVLRALARVGAPLAPELAALAFAAQGDEPVRFAGWIGGRHDAGGDRFKLYADLPDAAAAAPLAALGLPRPRLPGPPARARMLGLGPAGRSEVYFHAEAPATSLPRLLEPAGRQEDAPCLLALIEDAWGRSIRDRLPGGTIGISYARATPQHEPVATIFLFARALWGGDGRIRSRMLERLARAGVAAAPYAVASEPLAAANSAQTRHGMVGITVLPDAEHWSVGLRPAPGPC